VVLTNFGNANTEAFATRAFETLEATGAMKPRVPVISDTVTPAMKTFLEVYNAFDAAKLQTILERQIDPREQGELAGYHALHGTCTAFKPMKMLPGGVAAFAFTCEHGNFELDANFDGAGKLVGFLGRSAGIAPPANVAKLFNAALALHFSPTFSSAIYKQVFPKNQVPEANARAVTANLKAQFGTCKPGAYSHEGFGWTLDLVCTKGNPVALSIELDPHGDIGSIQFHPPAGQEPQRCPTR